MFVHRRPRARSRRRDVSAVPERAAINGVSEIRIKSGANQYAGYKKHRKQNEIKSGTKGENT